MFFFRPEQEMCPVDGHPLHVLNTKTRTIKTTGIGTFIAHHTLLYCPEHPELGTWKSSDLAEIVPPDSNVSYSVIVEVGKLRFLLSRQVAEIQLMCVYIWIFTLLNSLRKTCSITPVFCKAKEIVISIQVIPRISS